MNNNSNHGLSDKFEIGLMIISILIVIALVAGLSIFPEQGKVFAANVMYVLTHTFGSTMQIITIIVLLFLVGLGFSKYGNIRFGHCKPQYKTISWVAMMFFTGLGAGTVYWAFLEWGYHFNAAPQLAGVPISEAYAYELSLAYSIYDWGPAAWALLCVFVLPFAYHLYIKNDKELRFSALCKYSMGDKLVHGWFGRIVDFIFIFAAVGSICISAGTSASTIAAAIANLLGISTSFALMVIVLIGTAVIYSISSLLGIEKGMRKISDWNVYLCIALLLFIFIVGPTQYIMDSLVNSLGVLSTEFIRMTLWTDPVAKSGYPQDWTVFYLVYWLVFGPFTGLFVAKISKGRKLKEIILNMLVTGSAGLFLFFGVVTAYQQNLRIKGILDVPAMLTSGQSEMIATATINTLPLAKIAMVLYLVVIILFLATTLDATSFALSSTVSKNLKAGEEPKKGLKFVWCLVLVLIPMAIAYAGTDITTIKAIVLATGLPLLFILIIIYHGFLREMKKDYGRKSRDEIIKESMLDEEI
ncbi:MAG: BCCT family transporter [Clostridia bacterium]|jgi:BCCT family betaine/carnitine transporter|nr:BCCT family transporter [Clostridia bacterium]